MHFFKFGVIIPFGKNPFPYFIYDAIAFSFYISFFNFLASEHNFIPRPQLKNVGFIIHTFELSDFKNPSSSFDWNSAVKSILYDSGKNCADVKFKSYILYIFTFIFSFKIFHRLYDQIFRC